MLEWFDFYGLAIYFTVNHDTKYRTRLGTILTITNILLIVVFLPVEFFTRNDIKHSWEVPAWQFEIEHNPTMFQKKTVSREQRDFQDVNAMINNANQFATLIQLQPNYNANFNQDAFKRSLDLLYNITSIKVNNLHRNKTNGMMLSASTSTTHS